MKYILFAALFFLALPVFSKSADSKDFPLSADDAFLLSIGILNNLNYKIEEIQSNSGYILFTVQNEEYLLMVSENNSQNSNIKIQKAVISSPSTYLNNIQNSVYTELSKENLLKRID